MVGTFSPEQWDVLPRKIWKFVLSMVKKINFLPNPLRATELELLELRHCASNHPILLFLAIPLVCCLLQIPVLKKQRDNPSKIMILKPKMTWKLTRRVTLRRFSSVFPVMFGAVKQVCIALRNPLLRWVSKCVCLLCGNK